MQFPYSFFEDEVKEGFYVPGMMKRAWAAQLEILEDISRVCKRHGIQYFAEWGTLLGAVRHGGFIPWDDDMDICMKRADYQKFLSVAAKELPQCYSLLNMHNTYNGEILWDFLTRVVNGRDICFSEEHLEKFHGFPYVAGIDIFPLDFLAPNAGDDELRNNLIVFITAVADSVDDENKDPDEMESEICQIEKLCNARIERNGAVKQQLYCLMERLFSLYGEQEAKEITMLPYGLRESVLRFPKYYYQESVILPFENTEIPVPAFYDTILRAKYGDYMKLIRRGGAHDYPFYKRQEMMLRERCGILPLKYDLTMAKREEQFPK